MVQIVNYIFQGDRVWFMMFNVTFNNISVISWQSLSWRRKPNRAQRDNHQPVASH